MKRTTADWKDISEDEAYKLSIAEYKGYTMAALQNIQEDIKDLKQDAKVRNWITFGIGAVSAAITSILLNLGIKPH